MFCSKCGLELNGNEKFCKRCGQAVQSGTGNFNIPPIPSIQPNQQTPPPKKKKKTGRIVALVTALVLVVGACGGVFVFRDEILEMFSKSDTYEETYDEIDESLNALMETEQFQNLSTEEKKDELISKLQELEDDDLINSDSITYQEENNMIWYKWGDGFDSGIMLEDFDGYTSGYADPNKYITEWYSYDSTLPNEWNSLINFSDEDYPFSEADVISLNLKAKYMFGLCDENDTQNEYYEYLTCYKNNKQEWDSNHLSTEIDDYCTVEDFKTGLSGYSIIFIEEHGNYDYAKTPMIATREEASSSSYNEDVQNHRIAKVTFTDGSSYWWIYPSFFEHYYENDKLDGTIIWIGSCHGYENSDLADAFEQCGAAAVIGFDDSVSTVYDWCLHTAFVYSLMNGDMASEALSFAKSLFKSNDTDFCVAYSDSVWKKLINALSSFSAEAQINEKGEDAKLLNLEEPEPTTEPESTLPDLVQAVLDGESTWTQFPEEYVNNLNNSEVYSWFQDLNMDGTPEFIVGPMVSGAHAAHDYEVWTMENRTLTKFVLSGEDYWSESDSNLITTWPNIDDSEFNRTDDFISLLYQDKSSGDYLFIFPEGDGVSTEFHQYLKCLNCTNKGNITSTNSLFTITTTYYSDDAVSKSYFTSNGEVSAQEFVDSYNSFFANLQPYDITVKDISYADYRSADAETKQSLLLDSYNAWSYQENSNAKLPLADEVAEIETISSTPTIFTQDQLNSVKKALGVPDDLKVTFTQDEPYYWYVGERWLTYVCIYYENEIVAYAACDSYTAELVKSIFMYSGTTENTSSESNSSEKTVLFTGTVNTEEDPLNVRSSPSADAEIIGKLEKGTTVSIYSETGDWYEIEYNGGIGYVSKAYILRDTGYLE